MHQIDQTNREVRLPLAPQRIVSLVPSLTELVVDMGLGNLLVGRTKYCIHPKEAVAHVNTVGGTKKINHNLLESLRPDLILAAKEENNQQDVELLAGRYPVYVSDIKNLKDLCQVIEDLGSMAGASPAAEQLVAKVKGFHLETKPRPTKVLYLIWNKPCMSVGNDTFIHAMLQHLGFANVLAEQSRYPVLTEEDLALLSPELVMLSSEPYHFRHKHVQEFQQHFPEALVDLVDGEAFSWYGTRILKKQDYLKNLVAKYQALFFQDN